MRRQDTVLRPQKDALGYNGYNWAGDERIIAKYEWDQDCMSVADSITNTLAEGDVRCYGPVCWERVGEPTVDCYVKNQPIKFQEPPETDDVCFDINNNLYWAQKTDKIDAYRFCQFAEFRNVILQRLDEVVARKKDELVFAKQIAGAHCDNRGNKTSCGFDFGSCEKPITLNCKNIVGKLSEVEAQLSDKCHNRDQGRPKLPHPAKFKHALRMSPVIQNMAYHQQCVEGCPLRDGTHIGNVMGVDLFESNKLPSFIDDAGDEVFLIPVGYQSATLMAHGLECLELDVPHPDFFGNIDRMLVAFDAEVMWPERMALLVAKFDIDCEACDPCA